MPKVTIPKGAPSKTVVSANGKTETTYYRDGRMLVKSKSSGYGAGPAQQSIPKPVTASQFLRDLLGQSSRDK